MPEQPRVGIKVERDRAHGRGVLEGIADYQLKETSWRVELVSRADLLKPAFVAGFDGLIVRVMDNALANALVASGKPVVDTYGRLDDNPLTSIRMDDEAIGALAAETFAERHFRNCAYCGFPAIRFSVARGKAFAASVAARGGTCATYSARRRMGLRFADKMFLRENVENNVDAKELAAWVAALEKPVAIFCCNDMRALQLQRVCRQAKLDLAHEISILGVDNDTVLCTFTNPSLSSIDTDPHALGWTAAEMLAAQMDAGDRRTVVTALHRPRRVVERMSTQVYPFQTPWLAEAVDYIRRNLAKGVTADDVVRRIGYSHPTVSRAFVAELGHPVKKEIQRQRSRLACRLLKETSYSAGEVSARCGYRSPQYFSHCFAEEFGVPPDVWRKS